MSGLCDMRETASRLRFQHIGIPPDFVHAADGGASILSQKCGAGMLPAGARKTHFGPNVKILTEDTPVPFPLTKL
jgi:hypothetical protein